MAATMNTIDREEKREQSFVQHAPTSSPDLLFEIITTRKYRVPNIDDDDVAETLNKNACEQLVCFFF